MAKIKAPNGPANSDVDEKSKSKAKEAIKEEKGNPAVKDALKKEKQPQSPDDLSPLHDNSEIGTSGGDQRATAEELKKAAKK